MFIIIATFNVSSFCLGDFNYFLLVSCLSARNYLNRLTLSVTREELLTTLSSVPCASGFSLNLASLDDLTVANVEVWSGGISILNISGYNYHFNMYVCMYLCLLHPLRCWVLSYIIRNQEQNFCSMVQLYIVHTAAGFHFSVPWIFNTGIYSGYSPCLCELLGCLYLQVPPQ